MVARIKLGVAAFIYSIFHALCIIGRCLFAIAITFAAAVAGGKVMFDDKEALARVIKFSMFFWLLIFLNIVNTSIRLAAAQRSGLWGVLGVAAAQVAFMVLCTVFAGSIAEFLFRIAKPTRVPAMWGLPERAAREHGHWAAAWDRAGSFHDL